MNYQNCKKILTFRKNVAIFPGIALFLFGALLALVLGAEFNFIKLILGLIIAVSAILSSQYSNEYFDREVDSCDSFTTFSGGSGILVENPELCNYLITIAVVLSSISILLAIVYTIIYTTSPLLLILVIAGNLLGWFYTAPPIKLSYHGWGELAFGLGDGFLLPAFGFLVFMGYLNHLFLLFVIPLFLYIFATSINKEIPDLESDKIGHKYTMIVRRGRKFGFKVVALLFLLSALIYLTYFLGGFFPGIINMGLVTIFSLITLSFGIVGALKGSDDREKSIKYVNFNMMAFKFIVFAVDLYLIYLLISR